MIDSELSIFTLPLYQVLVVITSGAGALHALLTKRDSKSALSWVAFCIVLPIFGPIIYLIFGINRTRTAAKENYNTALMPDSAKTFSNPAGNALRPYSLIGETVIGQGLHSCDDIQLLENGEENFQAMLTDIASATTNIYLSTYIFNGDVTGRKFLSALVAAKSRNVDVRVLIDGLGAIIYPPKLIKELRQSDIKFELFNPITMFPPSLHLNMRNHRKILIIDGNCAYTGGQNISDHHNVEAKGNPKIARDLHFRLTGKIVDDLERAFLRDWVHCCGEDSLATFEPKNINRSESKIWTRLILDGPNENLDKLNEVLGGVFSLASKRIWIMTPYFLPFPELVGALQAAILRGVDVKILLPEVTNIHLAHFAGHHKLPHLLAKNIPILLQPAPFIHTKAILVDDSYSLIGSANLDPRSLRLNFELGVEIFSTAFCDQLSAYFARHIAQATLVNQESLGQKSILIRVRNALAWLFSPYL